MTEGKRVLCLLNFPLAYDMQAGKFSGKQRISLFTNFPLHVNEGKLVDKEIFWKTKDKFPSCMSNEGNTRFTFTGKKIESKAIMVLHT